MDRREVVRERPLPAAATESRETSSASTPASTGVKAARPEAARSRRSTRDLLRTPLNAITGWAYILRAGSLDPAGQMKAVDAIRRNAQLQTQLIADILDVLAMVVASLASAALRKEDSA